MSDLPEPLAYYRIRSSLGQPSIGGLEQDLAQRHKVIVALNAEAIWNAHGNGNV